MRRRSGLALGLLLGTALDAVVADPEHGHPVAAFGAAAASVEGRLWADSRTRGVLFATVCAGPVLAAGLSVQQMTGQQRTGQRRTGQQRTGQQRTRRGAAAPAAVAAVAVATWAVLGGTSLAAEACGIARTLDQGDLAAARRRLPALCGRDPGSLDAAQIARATVESVAENTCDAVVGPLVWGAVCGLPGLLGYRAVNTLDAMVGHRTPRYERFGWAAARLDDMTGVLPARLTALLAVALAPAVGGSQRRGVRVLRRDGARHPSPNAGPCEAAFAGALGVRLGGTNVYNGRTERRGLLGDGPPPTARDIDRAVALSRLIGTAAAALAALIACAVHGEGRP